MNTVTRNILIGVGGFVLIIIIIVWSFIANVQGSYNRLVSEREAGQTMQAQVQAQEQRRLDLLPNAATVAKAGLVHEENVFANISKAQAAFTNAQNPVEQNNAGNQLGAALRGYLVVAQQYPELRGLNSIETLTTEIEGTENRISVARQRYNEAVQVYDQDMQTFRALLVANYFHFQQLPFFQADTAANKAPDLKGNLK